MLNRLVSLSVPAVCMWYPVCAIPVRTVLSICVICVFSGFTIVITSLWPYLELVCMTCSLLKVLKKKNLYVIFTLDCIFCVD